MFSISDFLHSKTIALAKGLLSLAAVIILWAGIWLLCDRHIPAGTYNTDKELLLIVLGACVMILADVFFTSAFMDRFSKIKSIFEFDHAQRRGGREKFRIYAQFYTKSVLGMIGTILFWNGVFNLLNKATISVEHQFVIHITAVLCGSIVVLYVVHLEDQSSIYINELTNDFGTHDHVLTESRLCDMVCAYLGAFICNFAQVVLWWGVETYAEMHMKGQPYIAAALFIGGLLFLKLMNKLEVNLGVEIESTGRYREQFGQCGFIQFFLSTCELISVVLIWTGFEWFFWEDFLLRETALRDAMYSFCGFMVIVATGRLVTLMGIISPMGVYGEIHSQLLHNEDPLLERCSYYEDSAQIEIEEIVLHREW